MEKGYVITVKTNAEFLNTTFGTTYKQWYKSTYNLDDETTVWMIRIDSKERDGFKNYFEDGCIIEESNTEQTRSLKPIRMVFQILEENGLKTFVYLGKYKMDNEKSTIDKRVFVAVE